MNKRFLLISGITAALSLALIALPAHSAKPQNFNDSKIARLQQEIEKLQAQLQEELENRPDQIVEPIEIGPEIESAATLVQESPDFQGGKHSRRRHG
jgi:hypothetical protein